MFAFICISLLFLAVFDKPVDKLLGRINDISWKDALEDSWDNIVHFSRSVGRDVTRTALLFYFTLKDGELTPSEKAILYAGIIYVVVPSDFLPRAVLGLLGIMDDVTVTAWICSRVQKHISPAIRQKTEETLLSWFGPEAGSATVLQAR